MKPRHSAFLMTVVASLVFSVFTLSFGEGSAKNKKDNAIPLPDVLGKPRSIQVASAFGTASDTIPILVSPGRRNIQPQLALSYNSMGGLADTGLGWQLDIGSVTRWRGDGTPTAGDPGTFAYAIAGAGGQLIHTGNGVYRAKIESLYREFRFEEGPEGQGFWVMDNGEGAKHYFGSYENSRIGGELWMLDYVKDGSGNTITYQYIKDAGAIYISKIFYTGYAPTQDLGSNQVVFEYENRPARNVRVSYGNSVYEERRKRLKRISVFTVGNQLVRRYELNYQENALNGQMLLQKVTLVGADDSSRIVLRNLAYGLRSLTVPDRVYSTLPVDLAVHDADFKGGRETGVRILDLNGDGFADVVENEKANGLHHVYLGDGNGNFSLNTTWSNSLTGANIRFVTPTGDHRGADEGVRLLDVDADGLADIFIAKPNRREIWINTGMGWQMDAGWTASIPAVESVSADSYYIQEGCSRRHCDDPAYANKPLCVPHCQGTPDDAPGCLPAHCQGTQNDPPGCLPPHCTSSQVVHNESFALVDEGGDSKGVQLVDVNGDSRVDIVWSMTRTEDLYYINNKRVPLQIRSAYLNTGSGWQWNQALTNALIAIGDKQAGPGIEFVTDSELQGYDFMDVNGDGLADIVGTREGKLGVFLATGSGWVRHESYSTSLVNNGLISLNSDKEGQGLMPADFNDDGLIDYLRANETVTKAYYNTGTGWLESTEMASLLSSLGVAFSSANGKATGILLADIDGDGISDFVKAKDGVRWLSLSKSMRSGLLVWAKSAIGEETTLNWGLSTNLDNVRPDGVQGLPSPMPVVTSITSYDGRGHQYTTSFQYGGGLFQKRQFRGFAWSDQMLPSQIRVKKWYFQDEELVGRMKQELWYDNTRQYKTSSSSFETVENFINGKKLTQVLLYQTDEDMIDPGGSLKTSLKYAYGEKLNITSVYRDPDVDKPNDETTTIFTWASNGPAGIWSLPARTTVVQGHNGNVLSEFIMLYDGLPEGQATKGLASKRRSLAETGAGNVYVEKRMEYDKYGNIVSLIDGTGNATTFKYGDSTATFRTQATDPEGRVVKSQYDPRSGDLVWDEDASGNRIFKNYDAFGRLTKFTLPGDDPQIGTRNYEYSELGTANMQWYRVRETETPGEAGTLDTVYFFDGMGRLYQVDRDGPDGQKVVTLTEFDDADNPIATSRPFFSGETPLFSEIARDKMHRPLSIKEPDGIELTLKYAGPRVEVTDRRGSATVFHRSPQGKTTETHQWVEGKEQVTKYSYDPLGGLTAIVDALGSETLITYDALDRRTSLKDPNAGTYTYQYDGEGRLVRQFAPGASQPTIFVYNKAGDLVRKQFPDETFHAMTYGEPGGQNTAGRLVRVEDSSGTVEMSYDVRGNIVQRRRSVLGRTYVTGYSYDSIGRIRRITYPDGFTVYYQYDSGGNLGRIVDGQGRVIAEYKNHNAAGQIGETNFGNGVRSGYGYDELLRMTAIKTRTPIGNDIQDLMYVYDEGGNIRRITDQIFGDSQEFSYDSMSRLTKAIGRYGEEIYEYDPLGNLLRKGSLVFKMDPAHPQRVIFGEDIDYGRGKSPGRSFHLAYDEAGNVIEKGDQRFEYDAENHLVRVRDAKGKLLVENVYDAAGNRVIQRTRDGATVFIDGIYEESKTHASRHVKAGDLLVATIMTPLATVRLIEEAPAPLYGFGGTGRGWDMAGGWPWILAFSPVFALGYFLTPGRRRIRRRCISGMAAIGSRLRSDPIRCTFTFLFIPLFLFVNSQSGSGGVVLAPKSNQSIESEKRYYYHSNHLGSINVVTNDTGGIVERRDYSPYGDRMEWTGPNSGPRELLLTFGGHQYDDATGFYYLGARHYDPETGRFLNADTEVPDPMDPKSLNRYAFAGDNPIRYSDPTGHGFWDWIAAIVIIVVLAVVGIVTCGAGLAIGLGVLGGALLFTAGMAAIGGAALGIYFLTRVPGGFGGDFSWKSFGMALAAGAAIGAAVGASCVLLPFSIGTTWAGGIASFAGGLAADAFIGAVLGGVGTAIQHMANGGGPEEILTSAVGFKIATAMIKGALFGLLAGGVLNKVGAFSVAGRWLAALISAGLTGEALWEDAKAGYAPSDGFSFLNMFGTDPDWFNNSPTAALGIPGWAFEGTWLGFGHNPRGSAASPLLATMPLTP